MLIHMIGDIQTDRHNLHGSPSPDCGQADRLLQEPGWVHYITSVIRLRAGRVIAPGRRTLK